MGIFFALLSYALYGANNYIDKFFLEKFKVNFVVLTIYSGIFAFFTGLIILLFTGFYHADLKSIVIILASGFFTNLYILPYFKALSEDETSRVIPLFQLVPIFVLFLSFFLLGEKLLPKQYLGSVLIISGSFLISLKEFSLKIFRLRPAFWHMMLSSLLVAFSVVLYKFGVATIPFWQTLPYEAFGIALGALAVWSYGKNKIIFKKETKKMQKRVFVVMSCNELLYLVCRYSAYFALSLIPASIVSLLGGSQPVFVLLYGIILSLWFPKILKEVISKKVLGQKIFSIILIFIGLGFVFL